jgi:aspartokinase
VTRVSEQGSGRPLVAVTGMSDLAQVRGRGGADQLRRLGEILQQEEISPLAAWLVDGHPSLLIARQRCHDYPRLRHRFAQDAEAVAIEEGLDAATVIGEGLSGDPARLAEVLRLAEREAWPLRAVDAGTRRLTLVMESGRLEAAVEALHGYLLGRGNDRVEIE